MLPRERRLISDYDFRRVRRMGGKISTPFFDLYHLKTGEAPSRFGFVISTKIDKRAAKRNRIRRILREEVRAILPKIRDGFDLVFWVKQRSLTAESDRVRTAIKSALRKGGLVSDEE